MKIVKDAILIAILAAIIGLAVNIARNLTSTGGLPMDTPWPDNRKPERLEYPPSIDTTEASVDTLVTLEQAYSLFLSGGAIFIDAREQIEYDEGHIKGALNLPFEEFDDYWPDVEPKLSPNDKLVVYCDGLDCELSLFCARELNTRGYINAYTFFGGWLQWIDAGLPVEKSGDGDD